MDPNETLRQLREAMAEANTATDPDAIVSAKIDVADAAEALDGWLTRGGFLPDAWNYPFGGRYPRNRDRVGGTS